MDAVVAAGRVAPAFVLVVSFCSMHQDIDIEITTGASATFDSPLENMDFVLRHGTGDWPQMRAHRIFDDAYIPVCSKTMAQRLRTPADLFDAQLLHTMMIPTAWQHWFESAGIAGTPTQPGLTLANAALCYQAAIDGLGVAMAQKTYVQEDLALERLVQPFAHIAKTGLAYYLVCDSRKASIETLGPEGSNPPMYPDTVVGAMPSDDSSRLCMVVV